MQKQISLIPTLALGFYYFNNQKILVVTKNNQAFYTRIPHGVHCVKNKDILFLKLLTPTNLKSNLIIFQSFTSFLVSWLKRIEKPFIKKLFLKGLGLKASHNAEHLELKLGLSHVIKIQIPTAISKIVIKKQTLSFESSDKLLLGNFLSKIRNLNYPNIYKGKGIWYKNETITLKAVKKS